MPPDMLSPKMLLLASRYQGASVATLCLVTMLIDPNMSLGIAGGGLLMAGNFWVMRVLLIKAFGDSKPSAAYALLLIPKFGFTLVAMWALVSVLKLDPAGIALGLSTLFLGIGLGVTHLSLQPASTSLDAPVNN